MLTPERGLIFASAGAFLVGLGMGFSNLTYLVAVQTSVDWRRRGIATSLNLFMRMVGQSVGTACFGALVNFGVARFAMSDPEIVNRMMDPSVRRTIAPGTLERVSRAMAASLHDVYLIALLLSIAALVIATRIPGELNAKNAIQASKPA
jgi:MFS family permease